MTATHNATLQFPDAPSEAQQAHMFPDLHQHSLLSIGKFCDQGYEAVFTNTNVTIQKPGHQSIHGQRHPATGLWTVPLPTDTNDNQKIPSEQINSVYATTNLRDLVQYLHQCCYSPTPSAWIKAIQLGNFATWPGLTADLVRKHLPKSAATVKGHLRQTFKNTRSTSNQIHATNQERNQTRANSDEGYNSQHAGTRVPQNTTESQLPQTAGTRLQPTPNELDPEPNERTHWIYAATIEPTGKIYTDQTGRFPTTSSKGNKYIMVLYDYDSNAILAEPMKSRSEQHMVQAYTKLHTYLVDRGLKPQLQKLDNEASAGLKRFMTQQKVQYQLVPPHIHRRNAAEKAISTFKDHLIAGICSTDKQWPIHLWCRLIPQATLTLNLLRQSRINPRLSSDAQLNGIFDFNATPLAPPGTRVIVHDKSTVRRTWAPHGTDGWYEGPAREHYRCYRIYSSVTGNERVSDTVEFFPTHTKMPHASSADNAMIAAKELTAALLNPAPAAPFAHIGDAQLKAIKTLAAIFQQTIETATAPPRVPVKQHAPATTPTTTTTHTNTTDPPHIIPDDRARPHISIDTTTCYKVGIIFVIP
jgi:hypothetical protein